MVVRSTSKWDFGAGKGERMAIPSGENGKEDLRGGILTCIPDTKRPTL